MSLRGRPAGIWWILLPHFIRDLLIPYSGSTRRSPEAITAKVRHIYGWYTAKWYLSFRCLVIPTVYLVYTLFIKTGNRYRESI